MYRELMYTVQSTLCTHSHVEFIHSTEFIFEELQLVFIYAFECTAQCALHTSLTGIANENLILGADGISPSIFSLQKFRTF
jgi:hypothetical protein